MALGKQCGRCHMCKSVRYRPRAETRGQSRRAAQSIPRGKMRSLTLARPAKIIRSHRARRRPPKPIRVHMAAPHLKTRGRALRDWHSLTCPHFLRIPQRRPEAPPAVTFPGEQPRADQASFRVAPAGAEGTWRQTPRRSLWPCLWWNTGSNHGGHLPQHGRDGLRPTPSAAECGSANSASERAEVAE
jgi:hypothetical protein